MLGFLAALVTAKLLNSRVMKASSAPFVLELPQYRWPTPRSLALRLYDRGKLFVKKAGTIILACTFVVWVLSVLPVHGGNFSDLSISVIGHIGHFIEPVIRPLGFDWKIGIGLLSSIVAREVIVGTLGTLYGVDPATHCGQPADSAASRPGHRRRHRPGRLLRLRDAVHLHDRRRPPRDE